MVYITFFAVHNVYNTAKHEVYIYIHMSHENKSFNIHNVWIIQVNYSEA